MKIIIRLHHWTKRVASLGIWSLLGVVDAVWIYTLTIHYY